MLLMFFFSAYYIIISRKKNIKSINKIKIIKLNETTLKITEHERVLTSGFADFENFYSMTSYINRKTETQTNKQTRTTMISLGHILKTSHTFY